MPTRSVGNSSDSIGAYGSRSRRRRTRRIISTAPILAEQPEETRVSAPRYTGGVSGILISGAGGYVGGRVIEAGRGQRELHALWRTQEPPPGTASQHRLDLDDAAA